MKLLSMALPIVFINFLAILAVSETAIADDELYLCGVVKEVNTEKKVVVVQVISEGCAGEKSFKVAHNQRIDRFVAGKEACFMIDVNTCPKENRATIIAE